MHYSSSRSVWKLIDRKSLQSLGKSFRDRVTYLGQGAKSVHRLHSDKLLQNKSNF